MDVVAIYARIHHYELKDYLKKTHSHRVTLSGPPFNLQGGGR